MPDRSIALSNRQYPWLKFVPTCASTNTWASEHRDRLLHGDVVFTPQQTAGKGQHGRNWVSPPGVLTASFILDGIPTQKIPGLSLVAGLATIEAVASLCPGLDRQLQLKWVNDIWLDRRKLAGILCESAHDRAIVGIGLNRQVTFADPTAIGYPVSLHEFVASVPDEVTLLDCLRQQLLTSIDRLIQHGLSDFLAELHDRDALVGQIVEVQIDDRQVVTGAAMGFDPSGGFRLQTADGQIHTLINGRIVKWEQPTSTHVN
jgi:BirA family transcriptional regulator, biotin operon repressor / biotin---[acetyl-CoA-carboxylase] ligase